MKVKLKPCPFCGDQAYMWTIPGMKGLKVSCRNDCVTMPPRFDVSFSSEEETIKAWNKREEAKK